MTVSDIKAKLDAVNQVEIVEIIEYYKKVGNDYAKRIEFLELKLHQYNTESLLRMSKPGLERNRTIIVIFVKEEIEKYKKLQSEPIKSVDPIHWLGSEADLHSLFDALKDKDKISNEQYNERHSLIVKHFVNKEGKNFKRKQLSTSHSLSDGTKKRKKTKKEFMEIFPK